MKAAAIPEEVVASLVEALRDPEIQVRANAAHALARLDPLPETAISPLIECTADAHDGLRMNAAIALKLAPAGAADEVMQHLVADPNSRVRLIAASFLFAAGLGNAAARAVLNEALGDPALRVRKAALELVESLGTDGAAFLESLKRRDGLEAEAELRDALARLIERLESQAEVEMQPVADSA
jgi:HEAT repeat protein